MRAIAGTARSYRLMPMPPARFRTTPKPPANPALPKCLSNEQAGVCRRTLYRLLAITSRCTSLVPS